MSTVVDGKFDEYLKGLTEKRARRPKRKQGLKEADESPAERPVDLEEIRLRRAELARKIDVPSPPFWGARVVEEIPMKSLVSYLNETMLFHFQWGFRKGRRSTHHLETWIDEEIRPILHRMVRVVVEEKIFAPRAAYGYWKAASEGDEIVMFDEGGEAEVARFGFSQTEPEGRSLCCGFFPGR